MKPLHLVVVAAMLPVTLVGWGCDSSYSPAGSGPAQGDQGNQNGTDAGSAATGSDGGTPVSNGGDGGSHPSGEDGGSPPSGDDAGPPVTGSEAGPSGPNVCFGSHPMQYPSGTLMPSGAQADLDSKVASAYDSWKSQYVKQGCGGYYVLSGGGTGTDVGDEVSEGHGYGMVITALMACHDPDAKTIFDGMYAFFKAFPTGTHQNLMAWTVDVAGGCKIPGGGPSDSATDGDLDIAYSLVLADKQWPGNGYLDKAKAVIADLKSGDQNATTHLTTLGDWSTSDDPDYFATRPSDFMIDHFRAFGKATGDAAWTQGVDATYSLIATMQTSFASTTGLLPDFVVTTNTTPAPAAPNFLEADTDGEYSWNSCRFPWHLATDYLVSGDSRGKSALQLIDTWIIGETGGDPSQIKAGYTLSGGAGTGQSGFSSAFASPFGVAAMAGTNQGWVDGIWGTMAMNSGYYGDSITMLDMIVMSGNWWAP